MEFDERFMGMAISIIFIFNMLLSFMEDFLSDLNHATTESVETE